MPNYKHTDEEFIIIVEQSSSIRQVLIQLGLIPQGGNYRIIHNRIKRLNIDTSHFKGQGWSKDIVKGATYPLEDYFSGKRTMISHKFRIRLLQEHIFEYKCYNCNNTEWLNGPIPLELEHIDGNHQNNQLNNLTLLCPNCHALTHSYRGKNKKSKT